MAKLAVFLAFVLAVSQPLHVLAQAPLVDFWGTKEACLAAKGAPFYRPTKPRVRPTKTGERIVGNPIASCFLMELPDRAIAGGKGWVRIEEGREIIVRVSDGKPLRLQECDNEFFEDSVPIPEPPGQPGPKGDPGPQGPQGLQGPQGDPGKNEKIRVPEYPPTPPANITVTQTQPAYTPPSGSNKGLIAGIIAAAAVAGLCIWKCKGGGSKVEVSNTTFINNQTPAFVPVSNSTPPAPVPPAPGPIGVPLPPLPTPGSSGTAGTTGGASPLPPCPSPPCSR